jgi:hypothetical protein
MRPTGPARPAQQQPRRQRRQLFFAAPWPGHLAPELGNSPLQLPCGSSQPRRCRVVQGALNVRRARQFPSARRALQCRPEQLSFEGMRPDVIVGDCGGIDDASDDQRDAAHQPALAAVLSKQRGERPLGDALDQPAEPPLQLRRVARLGAQYRMIWLPRRWHSGVAQLDRPVIDDPRRPGRALQQHHRRPPRLDAAAESGRR